MYVHDSSCITYHTTTSPCRYRRNYSIYARYVKHMCFRDHAKNSFTRIFLCTVGAVCTTLYSRTYVPYQVHSRSILYSRSRKLCAPLVHILRTDIYTTGLLQHRNCIVATYTVHHSVEQLDPAHNEDFVRDLFDTSYVHNWATASCKVVKQELYVIKFLSHKKLHSIGAMCMLINCVQKTRKEEMAETITTKRNTYSRA